MQSRDYENNSSQQSESRRNSHARKHFEDTIELEKFMELEQLQDQLRDLEETLLVSEEEMKLKDLKINTIESINEDLMERLESYQDEIENYQ